MEKLTVKDFKRAREILEANKITGSIYLVDGKIYPAPEQYYTPHD